MYSYPRIHNIICIPPIYCTLKCLRAAAVGDNCAKWESSALMLPGCGVHSRVMHALHYQGTRERSDLTNNEINKTDKSIVRQRVPSMLHLDLSLDGVSGPWVSRGCLNLTVADTQGARP